MHFDLASLHSDKLNKRFHNSWVKKPLTGSSLEFGRVVLAHPWPCKADILRWVACVHRSSRSNAEAKWRLWTDATMTYFMSPANLSDRRLARSRDECYYVDMMSSLIRNGITCEKVTYYNLPLCQVLRLPKELRNAWWFVPPFCRANLVARFLLLSMRLYLPHDAYEASFLDYASLYRQFAHLTPEMEEMAQPKLFDEPMPPVAHFWNVQLNPEAGLQRSHPIRKLLEKILLMETCVMKLSMFQKMWEQGRCVIIPRKVIERIRETGVAQFADIGVRHHKTNEVISPSLIVQRMLQAHMYDQEHRNCVQKVTTDFPFMGSVYFFWVTESGLLDKTVPDRREFRNNWFSRHLFPPKTDAMNSNLYWSRWDPRNVSDGRFSERVTRRESMDRNMGPQEVLRRRSSTRLASDERRSDDRQKYHRSEARNCQDIEEVRGRKSHYRPEQSSSPDDQRLKNTEKPARESVQRDRLEISGCDPAVAAMSQEGANELSKNKNLERRVENLVKPSEKLVCVPSVTGGQGDNALILKSNLPECGLKRPLEDKNEDDLGKVMSLVSGTLAKSSKKKRKVIRKLLRALAESSDEDEDCNSNPRMNASRTRGILGELDQDTLKNAIQASIQSGMAAFHPHSTLGYTSNMLIPGVSSSSTQHPFVSYQLHPGAAAQQSSRHLPLQCAVQSSIMNQHNFPLGQSPAGIVGVSGHTEKRGDGRNVESSGQAIKNEDSDTSIGKETDEGAARQRQKCEKEKEEVEEIFLIFPFKYAI